MIRIKDHKQRELFDPWRFLSPKRRQMLDRSWPGLFKNELLSELPVDKLIPFFIKEFGRPTKELYTVLGTFILQQTLDFTDEETCDQLAYNIQWHYALNITEESDSAKYICPKTLWNMRSILVENELDGPLMECTANKLRAIFNVNMDHQRLDSVHIKSNMRRLGRITIFVSTIHKFLKNLKRQHHALFETVNADVVEKYLPEKFLKCFSMVKPSESHKTLAQVGTDLFDLVMQFKDSEAAQMHSYKLLARVLNEQCNVKAGEGKSTVEVKPPKEVPSDSLQNPSDPDATYSGHKGQGYHVQIMETYAATDDPETREKTLNLITHVEVNPAHESDANALLPAIESTKKSGLAPEEILADSVYGSDENCQQAEQQGVQVVSPVMGTTKSLGLTDFTLSEKGVVLACPQGHAPVAVKKKKTRCSAAFDSEICAQCPRKADCPVKAGKKYHYLRYTEKEIRIALRRAYEQTNEFQDRYRWRAGVEATMSEYARRTGVKRLRVRGLKAVRFCATLKAIGINLLRAAAVWMAMNAAPEDDKSDGIDRNHAFLIVKERFFRTWHVIKNYFRDILPGNGYMIIKILIPER